MQVLEQKPTLTSPKGLSKNKIQGASRFKIVSRNKKFVKVCLKLQVKLCFKQRMKKHLINCNPNQMAFIVQQDLGCFAIDWH